MRIAAAFALAIFSGKNILIIASDKTAAVFRYGLFVKMCLEQPAGCDKHEINNIISLFYAQSKRGGHFKS